MFRVPVLDEPIKPHGLIRFIIVWIPCILLRFWVGPIDAHVWILHGSFYWFLLLYFPMTNFTLYTTMFAIRIWLNHLRGFEWISVPKFRKFYKWYLNLPGSLVLSELVYQGWIYNQ
jgi:hypothetical protein